MMQKTGIHIILFAILSLPMIAQVGKKNEKEPYIITKTVDMPGLSKDKVYKAGVRWLKKLEDTQLERFNEAEGIYEAKSRLLYENDVRLENILLSKDAALRTKGYIYYTVRITAKEGKLIIDFTNFDHDAFISRYGKISFGLIVKSEKVPLDTCFEHTLWCNAVWENMKSKILKHITAIWMNSKSTFD
ncbi:MAG: DUF4468 domain-containing protein [Bacteroidales bacterium]|nr:DUF4468 domain-containing protein [Bacteroidales bacterium]